jgi:hypothetical protein
MFWKKKDKGKDGANATDSAKKTGGMTREQILAQAKANAAKATAEIGAETLDAVRIAMQRQQQKAIIEKALADIKGADEGKVRDNIKFMMSEGKPPKK